MRLFLHLRNTLLFPFFLRGTWEDSSIHHALHGGVGLDRPPWLMARSKDGTLVCALQRQFEALSCPCPAAIR